MALHNFYLDMWDKTKAKKDVKKTYRQVVGVAQ